MNKACGSYSASNGYYVSIAPGFLIIQSCHSCVYRYILKVMNSKCTYSQDGIVEATDAAMKHIQCLVKEGILCPVPLPAKNGATKTLVSISTRRDSICEEMMKIIEDMGHGKSAQSAGIKFGTDEDGNEVVYLEHYVRYDSICNVFQGNTVHVLYRSDLPFERFQHMSAGGLWGYKCKTRRKEQEIKEH